MAKIKILILFYCISFFSVAEAQVVDGYFEDVINDSTLEVTIAVALQSGIDSTSLVEIEFIFDDNTLSFSNDPEEGEDYLLAGNFITFSVKNIYRPETDKIKINLASFSKSETLNVTPVEIITLFFTINNYTGYIGLEWQRTNVVQKFGAPPFASGNWENSNTALPIELTNFSGKIIDSNILLSWATTTEINNYGFEIQRTNLTPDIEARHWNTLGFVSGNGNSNRFQLYSFKDKIPVGGSKFFYRLKQIDFDGNYEYSDEIEIEFIPLENKLFQNYPNPFNPTTNIKFSIVQAGKISIELYNITGEKIQTIFNEFLEPGFYSLPFSGENLASGIYFYAIRTNSFKDIKKMIFLK